ncbi:hypothetical protein CI238_03607 [Colletotrichum incanum]|uniref:Secreted protein n=1 Tax=Colletotrichum incanum TaxID=1573173 RepID=A0A166XI87_COLIC|nr:hypothetical protein CI238_03607 [Colletotrichum incanum]
MVPRRRILLLLELISSATKISRGSRVLAWIKREGHGDCGPQIRHEERGCLISALAEAICWPNILRAKLFHSAVKPSPTVEVKPDPDSMVLTAGKRQNT